MQASPQSRTVINDAIGMHDLSNVLMKWYVRSRTGWSIRKEDHNGPQ